MQLGLGCSGAIKQRRNFKLLIRINLALDPHLRRAMVLPVGKQTNAVTRRENGVEVLFEFSKRRDFRRRLDA